MGSGRRRPDATDSSGAPAAHGNAARSRRTRRVVLLAVLGALALSGVLAQPALANRKVNIVFSCGTTTFEYSGFPELEHNQVTERLRADGVSQFIEKFEFNGSTGTSVVPMPAALAAGMHKLSAEAHWNTNGVIGESGKHKEHKAAAVNRSRASRSRRLQQIAGSSGGWTADRAQRQARPDGRIPDDRLEHGQRRLHADRIHGPQLRPGHPAGRARGRERGPGRQTPVHLQPPAHRRGLLHERRLGDREVLQARDRNRTSRTRSSSTWCWNRA